MLCTSCSKPVSPVVAVDIDGTLADYHVALAKFAAEYLDSPTFLDGFPYQGDIPYADWFTGTFECDRTTFRQIKLAFRQGGMKRLQKPIIGGQTFVDTLRAEGAEVWLTTTRPHDRFDRVDPDTREWCRRNGIKFDGLLYDGDKMERLADIVDPERVVAVVDDQVNVLNEARDLFPDSTLILAAGRHNAKAPWDGNRLSLGNALPVVLKRVYKWHNNTKELSR
jgi:hypothetical protein